MNEQRQIPASECYFIADVEIKPRVDDEHRSTPFTAVARTGDALNHAYWGRVVHDLDGMQVKPRIPVDYNHNSDEIVGYANRFNTESGNLEISGALTPSKFDRQPRASEIIDKSEQGVPWEMSISFPGDMKIEEVPDGQQVVVNQREFTGPLTVIREWPLRSVAVTPIGQDSQTALEFSGDRTISITVISKDPEMSKDQFTVAEAEVEEVENDEAVDAADVDTVEATEDTVVAVETEEKPEAAEETKELSAPDGKAYMTAFGRVQGALYFAEGLSFEDARTKELERLQVENAELRNHSSSKDDGLEDAVGFSAGGDKLTDILQAVPGKEAEVTAYKG